MSDRKAGTWRNKVLVGIGVVVIGVAAVIALGYFARGMTLTGKPGAADIGFCQDMSFHHDQAVLMALLAQDRAGPTVKALATSILVSQSQQIGMMRGWLQLWHKPIVDEHPMAWMSFDNPSIRLKYCGATPQVLMPGMATPEELNQLWQSSGKAFDILFLQLMTRHHESGIVMSRDAKLHAKLDVVRNAARAMAIEQLQDIAQMRRLLQMDDAKPLPFP